VPAIFSSSAVETIQVARAGEGAGPGGWDVNVAIAPAWSGSLIFLGNRAPPGAALNLVPTPFYTSGGVIRFAGYPVTTVDQYTIPETGYDLYVQHLWVSGNVQLIVDPGVAEIIPSSYALPVANGLPQSQAVFGAWR
jgi:hypothetical protein